MGGFVTLAQLRERAAEWNLRGCGPVPIAQGALQTSAHRVGLPDQPAWLTMGTWLDLIDEVAMALAGSPRTGSPLTVQILAGEGVFEAPAWSHVRLEALSRAHGWSLSLRRPGSTAATAHEGVIDTAEITEWVSRAVRSLAAGDDAFWQGPSVRPTNAAIAELPTWEGFAREPDGSWRLGYFRTTPVWEPGDITDLVDLAWNSGIARAWLVPGPTLVFRGISDATVSTWRDWIAGKRRLLQRSHWHRVLRRLEPHPRLDQPYRDLVALLEQADQWPAHPVVLATEQSDLTDGLFCPGHTLVLRTREGWRWRSADGRRAGEGDSTALAPLFFSPLEGSPASASSTRHLSQASVWRCRHCENTYNPQWGDPLQAIGRDVAFENLPDSWKCPVCAAPPSQYAVLGGADVAGPNSR